MKKIERIVIAAGGTGGHIYPAIAIADEIKKMNPESEITFIGAQGRMEEKIIPESGYAVRLIDVSGFSRSLNLKNVLIFFKALKSLSISRKILLGLKPQVVLGTGGYVTGPVLKSAIKLGIPTALLEGNYYPGLTVKLLAGDVNKLILNFSESVKYFSREDNIVCMSYPVRLSLRKIPRDEAVIKFGLNPEHKVLFVFGGSQGANSINEAVRSIVGEMTNSKIQIIWQTGLKGFESIYSRFNSDSVKVMRYITNMGDAYSASDLIVCRAGISAIMEISAMGCASVLVPYPGSSENHQEKNARAMVVRGGAEMILDREINTLLKDKIFSLINDNAKLIDMRNHVKGFADPEAANKISELLVSLIKNSAN